MHATETSLPLVSIIMPAFNGEPYIGAAIRSVLEQSYARWELLILDDGSADRTAEIAEAFEKSDPRIRLFRNPKNLGAAQTRNRGFALAQGEWIALLDCDDIWHTDKLEKQLALASRGDILYCSYALIDESGKHLSDFLVPESTDYEAMLRESVLSCSTVLLRRSILAGQRFPTEYYHEDYVFWLGLLKAGYRAIACTEVLADYRLVKGSRSSDKRNAAKNRWLIYRRVEKLSIWKSAAVFAVYACHALRKHRRAR